PFSIELADHTPALAGTCVVVQVWTTSANPFREPGIVLGVKELAASSMPVFERCLVTRTPPPNPPSVWTEMPTPTLASSRVILPGPRRRRHAMLAGAARAAAATAIAVPLVISSGDDPPPPTAARVAAPAPKPVPPPPPTCTISVTSTPAAATVTLDG